MTRYERLEQELETLSQKEIAIRHTLDTAIANLEFEQAMEARHNLNVCIAKHNEVMDLLCITDMEASDDHPTP